jgi:nucleoside-diphosphate-sugar epimerase
MKKTVVTGATGLVGNSIVRHLLKRGDDVHVLVRDPVRARPLLPAGVTLHSGDITQPETLIPAFRAATTVYHAAGMPEQWMADEAVFDRVNRQGTHEVCKAALRAGVTRLDIFEKDPGGILREDRIDPNPKPTAYERSKQAAEQEVERFRALGLDAVFLNPSAVYGPGPVLGTLNLLLVKLARGEVPLLPPGGFSVTWVEEVARAHLQAESLGHSGERYLLADTHASIQELARVVARVMGRSRIPPAAPPFLLRALAALGEPLARVTGKAPLISRSELVFLTWNARVDSSRAQEVLGYQPMDLEKGVAQTLPSFVDHRDAG